MVLNTLKLLFHTNPFLFSRRLVVQVYERGARVLDGSFMTQDLSFGTSNSESATGSESSTVLSVSIVDPYVLLRMSDCSIRLLVGGMFCHSYSCFSCWNFLLHTDKLDSAHVGFDVQILLCVLFL